MTVHIVIRSTWNGSSVVKVFTDKDKAQALADSFNKPGILGSVITKEVEE